MGKKRRRDDSSDEDEFESRDRTPFHSRYSDPTHSSWANPFRHGSERDRSSCHKNDVNDTVNLPFDTWKRELQEVFSKSCLLDAPEEFWKFVRTYSTVQKKAQCKKDVNCYRKVDCVPVTLGKSVEKLYSQLNAPPNLVFHKFKEFCEVVCLYVDFKQREKFMKLAKLRDCQKNLPITQYREGIVSAVDKQRVVIVAGDTGCGKSTQVPQYLLAAGYKCIACTQPRRIACVSLSKRVSYETLDKHGRNVGYQIRFEKQRGQDTRILFITEGLLLRQVSSDPMLSSYDVIVIDEAHERHLHGDFLLGILKCLLHQRPELKIVLMSATINIELFQNFFAAENPCVIQVPGRLHPIKLHYRPISKEDQPSRNERFNAAPYIRILQLIDEKYPKEERGDVLMFLSGLSEITAVVEAAKEYSAQTQKWIILPLHSALSLADQDKVFDYPPEGIRKCVVATNIAETSITIDGIRFVVDSGKMKQMSYDASTRMQRLKEFWISRASAEQRKGRAGRTGPGVCYRLYPEEQYTQLEAYTEPEVQRVPLDSLLLQMLAMGLPDARRFPFLEAPPDGAIEAALVSLQQQGALAEDEKLTSTGRLLAGLPVDVALGKVLLMGSLFHQAGPALAMAAALSVQNPFTARATRDSSVQDARKELESDQGDPVMLLRALRQWLEVKQESATGKGSRSQSRRWCWRLGLEEQRFYEMVKLKRQFTDLLQDSGLLEMEELDEPRTSTERALRHGELRLLRSLQREHRAAGPRARRRLRLDVWQLASEGDEEPSGEVDIRDVEFRLKNDSSQLQSLVLGATADSHSDLTMLKLIIVSGLYPQLAVPDEFNACKSVSEILFHTRNKPYVALHPTSYFGYHPQILQLSDADIESRPGPGQSLRLPVSSRHQLLCYMSLLETTRPYLVNNLRMPAAQTLVLFSQSIDTNADFSRIVCDEWLQLDFSLPVAAANLVLQAAILRAKWSRLLTLKLEAMNRKQKQQQNEEGEGAASSQQAPSPRPHSSKEAARLSAELSTELPCLLHTDVSYSLKRLLAADRKVLYVGPGINTDPVEPNPFLTASAASDEFSADYFQPEPHTVKGGMRVTSFLTYNCLEDVDEGCSDPLQLMEWQCPNCELACPLTVMQQLQHKYTCQTPSQPLPDEASDLKEENETVQQRPNIQAYNCEQCGKLLYLTSTEVLRHRRQCKPHSTIV